MATESSGAFGVSARDIDGTLVLTAHGELDLVGGPRVLDALPPHITGPVTMDLADVSFMDSSGLRALLEVRQACERFDQVLVLVRPSAAVLRVLELVDLTGEFTVRQDDPAS